MQYHQRSFVQSNESRQALSGRETLHFPLVLLSLFVNTNREIALQAFKGFNDLSWHDWSKLTIMLLHVSMYCGGAPYSGP